MTVEQKHPGKHGLLFKGEFVLHKNTWVGKIREKKREGSVFGICALLTAGFYPTPFLGSSS